MRSGAQRIGSSTRRRAVVAHDRVGDRRAPRSSGCRRRPRGRGRGGRTRCAARRRPARRPGSRGWCPRCRWPPTRRAGHRSCRDRTRPRRTCRLVRPGTVAPPGERVVVPEPTPVCALSRARRTRRARSARRARRPRPARTTKRGVPDHAWHPGEPGQHAGVADRGVRGGDHRAEVAPGPDDEHQAHGRRRPAPAAAATRPTTARRRRLTATATTSAVSPERTRSAPVTSTARMPVSTGADQPRTASHTASGADDAGRGVAGPGREHPAEAAGRAHRDGVPGHVAAQHEAGEPAAAQHPDAGVAELVHEGDRRGAAPARAGSTATATRAATSTTSTGHRTGRRPARGPPGTTPARTSS